VGTGGLERPRPLGNSAATRREKQSRLFDMWARSRLKALRHAMREPWSWNYPQELKRHAPTADGGTGARDPRAADDAYAGCNSVPARQDRDRKKFNLVFEENCNYGSAQPMGLALGGGHDIAWPPRSLVSLSENLVAPQSAGVDPGY